MNKKFKTLLTAGLVTVIAGSSIVSSSALCKKTIDTHKTKGAVYLNINGKKYKIPLVVNNKPSHKEDTSTGNNNNQGNNNANTGNNNNQILTIIHQIIIKVQQDLFQASKKK